MQGSASAYAEHHGSAKPTTGKGKFAGTEVSVGEKLDRWSSEGRSRSTSKQHVNREKGTPNPYRAKGKQRRGAETST